MAWLGGRALWTWLGGVALTGGCGAGAPSGGVPGGAASAALPSSPDAERTVEGLRDRFRVRPTSRPPDRAIPGDDPATPQPWLAPAVASGFAEEDGWIRPLVDQAPIGTQRRAEVRLPV